MQIAKNVYMISGIQHGTNSNNYAMQVGNQILLFDAGYSIYQFDIMRKSLRFWGLENLPITHTFLTHSHFDHAGNAHLLKKIGSKIYAGPNDADGIETADERTIKHLFEETFIPCKVDAVLKDCDQIIVEGVTVTALHMPGHSRGSMIYQVEIHDNKFLIMGDFIALSPAGPADDVVVSLAWTGGPDYSAEDYRNSLKRALTLDANILLPGHGPVFYGNHKQIFHRAYQLATEL